LLLAKVNAFLYDVCATIFANENFKFQFTNHLWRSVVSNNARLSFGSAANRFGLSGITETRNFSSEATGGTKTLLHVMKSIFTPTWRR